ncbi:competence/damage-inducible protein A [uncultured Desulfovibrio sp.]|uniref:competence/damage-inducible protein A n=1 Tax=uncultured Desulfovibrio sp. TaxID=167968 RepID=UPI002619570E|nr:competence/damage-inducible protein A [uncultured Desulfovibrio sp.]
MLQQQGVYGMQAEIIAVGTELLLGHTVNSDAAHVARALAELGIDVFGSCVVGDNAARLERALRDGLRENDLIVTTGGLGPTDDDLTRETVARVAGVPLEEDADSLNRLREYFGSRPMGANQRKQALLPRGCTVFANTIGTAPGCAVETPDGRLVIMLPGPPSELLPMLRDGVVPFLEKRRTGVICSHMARTFGIGEGDAALLLAGLTSGANPSVATYATDTEMYVRITAKGRDAREAAALAAPALAEVRRRLGDRVYGVDVPHLQHVVVDELTRRGRTLATAESCTGGLLASLITDVPGASAVFHAGVVTYANEAKTRLLGVPPELLARVGAVSPEVARRMAEGVRRRHGSDWGVGITGIAGPGGGTPAKPVGLVYIALSGADGTWLRVMRPTGRAMPRAWTRMRAAGHALDMVRRALQGLPVVPA